MNGQCLCAAVQFSGDLIPDRGVEVCHCRHCRRWAGGPFMSVRFVKGVAVHQGADLDWYASSEWAERGFCRRCGTSLFWRLTGEPCDWTVNLHALGDDHGLTINEHIWVDQKPDFYDFADMTPRLTEAAFMARLHAAGE